MKKMMIIAAMVSVMLIPAQMEANNRVNNKGRVEYNNKKDFGKKEYNKFKENKRFDKKKPGKPQGMIKKPIQRRPPMPPVKVVKKKKPYKPAVIVVNKPAPRPRPIPPPPAPVRVVYESPVNAVAQAIGLAALAAIIAN